MPRHLLVTNDYPPKLGGIQNYLWELWRRLPPEEVCVLTRTHPGDVEWDAQQKHQVIRSPRQFLLPTQDMAEEITELATEIGAELVLYDPAVPLGLLAPRLPHPYGVILHGAEVTVPGRLPGSKQLLAGVLRGAEVVITAGRYSVAEAERAAGGPLPAVIVPPGVDVDRFKPLDAAQRRAARLRFGLPVNAPVVVSISRLVPRKGMDVLIAATARLADRHPGLTLAVAGAGRDRARLDRIIGSTGAPARLLDRVADSDLPDLYGCADVFAMVCRQRWGGLEQEGFGIVFLEAAAAGVPQLAGDSGGAAEAVEHGRTGLVVQEPNHRDAVIACLDTLLSDRVRLQRMGLESRLRAVAEFSYDHMAERLRTVIAEVVSRRKSR
ncbi:MAG: glycosyltransferase family 4 protein [Acidimicrobiia bacterium]|nr:glycosyltransferase family 4 protein [Acidimicrobiia bacterium]MYG59015.1 glycosyltransferase family 4 protein [Acidimicrobiia bacterium]MYJ33149.1 glycosyltransferase family 4 protein [Acidimicrobiia bacterium]